MIASPSYFPLWLGQLLSSFGDTLHYLALVVLVFELTGHGLLVAGVVAAEVVPVLLSDASTGPCRSQKSVESVRRRAHRDRHVRSRTCG